MWQLQIVCQECVGELYNFEGAVKEKPKNNEDWVRQVAEG